MSRFRFRSLTQRGEHPAAHVGWVAVGVTHVGYGLGKGPAPSQQSCPAEQHDWPQHVALPEQAPPSEHGIGLHPPLQYVP